jgi:hypothetical protein
MAREYMNPAPLPQGAQHSILSLFKGLILLQKYPRSRMAMATAI